jgi:hypothetical protein
MKCKIIKNHYIAYNLEDGRRKTEDRRPKTEDRRRKKEALQIPFLKGAGGCWNKDVGIIKKSET